MTIRSSSSYKNLVQLCTALCVAIVVCTAAFTVHANQVNEDDNWANDNWNNDEWGKVEEPSPWQFSGFVEAAYGEFTQQNILPNSSQLKEARARFNLAYGHQSFDVKVKGDIVFDDITAETRTELREFSVKFTPLDYLDIKIGKQVLTWGTGDYLFLNDLFPKDWQSFFSGRDDEYLKAASNSIKTSWYINDLTLDLVWTPDFTSDEFITGERFSFYSKQAQQQIAPENLAIEKPNDDQFFARLSTNQQGIEYALYAYKGRWNTPEGSLDSQQAYFPKMNSLGASMRTALGDGIVNVEVANYNSIESSHGYQQNTFAPNNQQRMLIGYETELIKNLTMNLQYYIEHTEHYSELSTTAQVPSQLVSQNRQLITTRLRYSALQQKLTLTLFNFYSPSDNDGFLKSSISYRQDDHWLYSFGANLFWGKDDFSFFGQHQTNSNLWGRVRYQF